MWQVKLFNCLCSDTLWSYYCIHRVTKLNWMVEKLRASCRVTEDNTDSLQLFGVPAFSPRLETISVLLSALSLVLQAIAGTFFSSQRTCTVTQGVLPLLKKGTGPSSRKVLASFSPGFTLDSRRLPVIHVLQCADGEHTKHLVTCT